MTQYASYTTDEGVYEGPYYQAIEAKRNDF